jgi:PAS domain S-box-containing protein
MVNSANNNKELVLQDLKLHKSVIDSLPVGVVTVDSDLHIISFNPWAARITGYCEKDALGRFCGEVLHGGMCNAQCPLRTVLNAEKPIIGLETTIENKSGETIPVRMNTAAMFDETGHLIGGVEAFQDISNLKALERERNNVMSMIAHDMKSPIIGIHGFAHRLLKQAGGRDEKEKGYLEIIEREAGKLETMLDDFLEFSRLQTGLLKLEFSATSVDKELHELYQLYEPLAAEQGLSMRLDSEEPLPIIEADPKRLRRVFTNLLTNAIKFSKEAGVITISTRETADEVFIVVSDEGIGIAAEDQLFIFDPFYRGKTDDKKREGFGLGLAGAKAIAEGHGGSIQVESQPGKGSSFTVRLPKRRVLRGQSDPLGGTGADSIANPQ